MTTDTTMGSCGSEKARIPDTEFQRRIQTVQSRMTERGIDGLLVFSHEAEPANVRYLSDYWPSFETAGVLVPAQGNPCLLIGPESGAYAKARSRIPDIRRLMDFRESSLPEYPGVKLTQWKDLLFEFKIRRLGVAGMTMMPVPIYHNLVQVLGVENVAPEEKIIAEMRMVKSGNELQFHRQAYRLAEIGLEAALRTAKPGMTEIQLAAEAEYAMLANGAETTGYPIWCCSGPNTNQAISRPTHRRLQKREIVQLCIGARLEGYSSSVGRVFVFGNPSDEIRRFIKTGIEAERKTLEIMKAGRSGAEIAEYVHGYIRRQGYGECILYGPAHGTGLMECEFPFIESSLQSPLVANMVFDVDIFLYTPNYGLRIEDGVVVTADGVETLSRPPGDVVVL